jgi:hypothetical protein
MNGNDAFVLSFTRIRRIARTSLKIFGVHEVLLSDSRKYCGFRT